MAEGKDGKGKTEGMEGDHISAGMEGKRRAHQHDTLQWNF